MFNRPFRYRLVLFIFLLTTIGSVFSSPNVHARDILSGILPNDKYYLTKNGVITNGDDCLDGNGNPVCDGTTGYEDPSATSHQYVTIGDNINDDNGSRRAGFFKQMSFTVITRSKPTSDTKITLYLTNRGIQKERACNGYKLSTAVDRIYQDGNGNNHTDEIITGSKKISTTGNQDCNSIPPIVFDKAIPANYFVELKNSEGYARGQWRANFKVKYQADPGELQNKQASFHIRSDVGNIGYKETTDNYWVNTYPTKNSTDHKIRYFVRPTCEGRRDVSISFDDLRHPLQTQNITVRLFKIKPNSSDTNDFEGQQRFDYFDANSFLGGPPTNGNTLAASINTRSENGNTGDIRFTAQESGGVPYGYMLEFDNVAGGNGISVTYPDDSTEVGNKCTTKSGWKLNNDTYRDYASVGVAKVALPTPPTSTPKPNNPDYPSGGGANCSETGPYRDVDLNGDGDTSDAGEYTRTTTRERCETWNSYFEDRNTARATNTARVKAALSKVTYNHRVFNYDNNGDDDTKHVTAPNGAHKSKIQYMFDMTGGERNGAPASTGYLDRFNGDYWSANIAANDNYLVPADNTHPATGSTTRTAEEMMAEPRDGDRYCERVLTYDERSSTGGAPVHSGGECVVISSSTDTVCQMYSWNITVDNGYITHDETGSRYGETYGDALVGNAYGFSVGATKSGVGQADTTLTVGNTIASPWWSGNRKFDSRWDERYVTHNVVARDGGATIQTQHRLDPTWYRNSDCVSGGPVTRTLSLAVPYYYSITPYLENVTSSTEQGDTIDPRAEYTFTKETNDRGNTWTNKTQQYKITEVEYAPATTPPAVAAQTSNEGNPCTYVTGSSACTNGASPLATPADRANEVEDGGRLIPSDSNTPTNRQFGDTFSRLAADTETKPVGTKLCYIASLSNPIDDANGGTSDPTWRHSAMACTTIVKKPKVQFMNGDLTVGRSPQQQDGTCPSNNAAIIQTASGRDTADLRYGSWIEYGAFATGEIRQFGSATSFHKASDVQSYKRLLFGNTFTGANQTPGRYSYTSKCLSNAFGIVDLKNSNEIGKNDGVVPSGNKYTIVPGNYFSHPDRSNRTQDKTGYVTTQGKDLVLGQPVDTDGGTVGAVSDDEALANPGTYSPPVMCGTTSSTPPTGWAKTGSAVAGMAHSNGCDGDGTHHRLQVMWSQGVTIPAWTTIGWKYTAPSNTQLVNIRADRYMEVAQDDVTSGGVKLNFADPYAITGDQACVRFANTCPKYTVDTINQNLSGSTFEMSVYCSVSNPSRNSCESTDSNTSVGLSNIRVTLKDNKTPSVGVQLGGLYKNNAVGTGAGEEVRGTVPLRFSPADGESGPDKYALYYKGTDGTWTEITSGAITQTNMEVNVNTVATFGYGATGDYSFRLVVWDKAGNQAKPDVWQKRINNNVALGDSYDAFTGRNIVMWARKDPTKPCSDPTSGGNITISDNIIYKTTGYSKISDLPRVMFMADCDITITDNVEQVDGWLIAANDIRTCDDAKFKNKTVTQEDCKKKLKVNGAVQAKRLLLLRTFGSDLTLPAEQQGPAEEFNLRPDQILSTWSRGQTTGVSRPIYEVESPPNW